MTVCAECQVSNNSCCSGSSEPGGGVVLGHRGVSDPGRWQAGLIMNTSQRIQQHKQN